MILGFLGDSDGRVHLQCRRPRFNPWIEKISWRMLLLLTPVFLPGEFHGQRILAGYSPWGHKESAWLSDLHTHTQNELRNDLGSRRAVRVYTQNWGRVRDGRYRRKNNWWNNVANFMWGKWDLNQSEELHPIRKCFLLKNRQEERTTRHRPRDEWRERKDFEALNLLENSSGWAPGIGVSLCGSDDKKLPAALRTQLLHSSMCLQWMQLPWPCEFVPTFSHDWLYPTQACSVGYT